MALLPRCIGRCRDGSQCSRRVMDAENPQAPLCHLHRANPNLSPIIPPADADVDAIKLLKQLTRSTDPRVKLRAVDLLISLQEKDEKDCERCARLRDESAVSHDAWRRLTDEQMQELGAMFKRFKELKALALTQPIHPGAHYV